MRAGNVVTLSLFSWRCIAWQSARGLSTRCYCMFQGTPSTDTIIRSRPDPCLPTMSCPQVWPWWSTAACTEVKASNGRQDFFQTTSISMELSAHGNQDGRDNVPAQIIIENTLVQTILWLTDYLPCWLSYFNIIVDTHILSTRAKDFGLLQMNF